jgi:hypothetical protein
LWKYIYFRKKEQAESVTTIDLQINRLNNKTAQNTEQARNSWL